MIKSSYSQLVEILDYTNVTTKDCIKKYTDKTHIK